MQFDIKGCILKGWSLLGLYLYPTLYYPVKAKYQVEGGKMVCNELHTLIQLSWGEGNNGTVQCQDFTEAILQPCKLLIF